MSFEVVFKGELVQGSDQSQVVKNLAGLFRTTEDKIAGLFSGKEVILKSNLDEATASKYMSTLKKAGAICAIRERQPVASQAQTPAAEEAASTAPAPASPAEEPAAPAAAAPAAPPESAAGGAFSLDPPGVTIIESQKAAPKEVDTSAFSLAPVGSDVLEGVEKAPPPPPPNTDELSIAPVGSKLLDKE